MKIVLAAVDEPIARAWETFCGDLPNVTVHLGSILDIDCDSMVSPANSFGFMDGGIDALYLDFFGPDIQTRVRRAIDDVLSWPHAMPRSWAEASEAHQLLYTDRPRRLQQDP